MHKHTHIHTHACTHTHTHIHTHVLQDAQHSCVIACECIVLNALTEDSQTSELANMWQYNPDLNHQITVELVELATNKVAIVFIYTGI